MEEKELLNNVFFVHKKVFLYLHNITFEPLICQMDNMNVVVLLLSMQGQKSLGFHQKYLNLCSEDERRVLQVWNDVKGSNCDPVCEIQAKVSKSNYEITSIKV